MIDWDVFEKSRCLSHCANLFLAGFQKCATTTVALTLKRHPDIFLPNLKEPHFFDEAPGTAPDFNMLKLPLSDTLESLAPRSVSRYRHIHDYYSLYKKVSPARFRLDASPSYVVNPNAVEMISRAIPNPKFILMLRDPYERAWSAYTYFRSIGREPMQRFSDAVSHENAGCRDDWIFDFRYVYVSRYAFHIQRLYRFVPTSHVLLLRTDLLKKDPRQFLDRITRFLDISPFEHSVIGASNRTIEHHNPLIRGIIRLTFNANTRRWLLPRNTPTRVLAALSRVRRLVTEPLDRFGSPPEGLGEADRRSLAPALEADLDALETLTGEDFSTWRA